MKVSAHRYRQSRQGDTFASSKWANTVIIGSVLGASLLFVLALAAAKLGI